MMHTPEEARAIAAKWYERIGIDKKYDKEFYETLAMAELPHTGDIIEYVTANPKGPEVLPILLYHCEALAERYRELGIGEDVLLAVLDDLRIYCEEWSAVEGRYTFGTTNWFRRHFSVTLFRLGRLQFGMTQAAADYPTVGLMHGENMVDVHIPRGGKMTPEACRESFRMAREFFARYFPDFKYNFFTCNSWLLDATLTDFLPEDSNIIRFGRMFRPASVAKGNYMLSYLYPIGTRVEDLPHITPKTRLAADIKEALLAGRVFSPTFGVIPAEEVDTYEV